MALRRTFFHALILTLALTAIGANFVAYTRPWFLHWGATPDELTRGLPGDEIVPNAVSQYTRAVTIQAPVEQVWPWLAQLGQDRGGFYSFDLLENIVGCQMPVEDVLLPEKQTWQEGDRLWMYPRERAGGAGFATLRTYVPGHAMGFSTRALGTTLEEPEDGSWSFVLDPIDDRTTRFTIRGRLAPGRSMAGQVFDVAFFEPVHFFMERRMMLGIKALAEGRDRDRIANHAQVGLWVMGFAVLVGAGVLIVRRRDWLRPLVTLLAAALVFQILTLGQPPLLVGVVLTALVAGLFVRDLLRYEPAQQWGVS
jgi:hypothetical protein